MFRTELGHKYILVECSVIALCLLVMSKITRYKLVCYKKNNDRYQHKTYLSTTLMPCFKTFRDIHPCTDNVDELYIPCSRSIVHCRALVKNIRTSCNNAIIARISKTEFSNCPDVFAVCMS